MNFQVNYSRNELFENSVKLFNLYTLLYYGKRIYCTPVID